MYPSLTLSKGFSTKGMFRNIGIDMKKMNKQTTKGSTKEEKGNCQHLFHPRVPASSKFLPGMVANLNSSLSSRVKIIKKICLYTHISVRLTLSVYLCVTLYFMIDKIENLLMLPSPEMLKIINMSVTKAAQQR